MNKKKKIRFPILLKVILLGIITSFIASTVAIIVNYNNMQERAKRDLNNYAIESLETAQVDYNLTNPNSVDNINSFAAVKKYVNDTLLALPSDDPVNTAIQSNYPSFTEYEKVYKDSFGYFYPEGMVASPEYLEFKENYNRVNPLLTKAAIYSGQAAFYAFWHPTIENRLIFMGDSRLESYRETGNYYHVAGSFYDLKPGDTITDIGNKYVKEYKLGKYSTRFIEIQTDDPDSTDLLTIGYMFVEYDTAAVANEYRPILIREIIILTITGLVVIILYAILSYFMFVKNINKLNKAALGISSQLKNGSNFELVDPNIKSFDEMKTLSDSFLVMENQLINYVDIIKADAKEKEKINAELEIASKIQLEALPKSSFNNNEVSIRSFIKAAKEVGGDFYDYFYINDHELAIIISDVSGKGIPAALFMMKSKALLKSQLKSESNLAKAVKEVNDTLNENNSESLFVTSFIGIINFEKEEIRYVNAGHEKPYIISLNKVIKLEGNSNFVLGGIDNIDFIEEKHAFHKGDVIFMFTDGLNESINPDREEFGYQRIEKALQENSSLPLKEVIKELNKRLDDFTSSKDQFDDVTMLIVKSEEEKLSLHYEKKDYSVIDEVVDKFNEKFSYIDSEVKAKVGIILDELINNFISYETRDDLVMDFDFSINKNVLIVQIKTNGNDYDPFKNHKDKYLTSNDKDASIGGFGIKIVKEFVDSHKYEYIDNHSIITLTKKLSQK